MAITFLMDSVTHAEWLRRFEHEPRAAIYDLCLRDLLSVGTHAPMHSSMVLENWFTQDVAFAERFDAALTEVIREHFGSRMMVDRRGETLREYALWRFWTTCCLCATVLRETQAAEPASIAALASFRGSASAYFQSFGERYGAEPDWLYRVAVDGLPEEMRKLSAR